MVILRRPTLRHINFGLFGLVLFVNAYIAATPFLPALFDQPSSVAASSIKPAPKVPTKTPTPTTAPAVIRPDALIIPRMGLDAAINEGSDIYRELDKGVWRWPGGSTPDKGGNTVMLGHRYTYTQPRGIFYFLNKVMTGDRITVVWNNQSYTYTVRSVQVVDPSDISILSPTSRSTLTLYTCTPLWNPTQRLVVTATLESQS